MPHKKIISVIALTALLLSGCSGGGSSTAEESFVIGSGVQTYINKGSRVKAPELSGMTLTGVNYTREPGKVAVSKCLGLMVLSLSSRSSHSRRTLREIS